MKLSFAIALTVMIIPLLSHSTLAAGSSAAGNWIEWAASDFAEGTGTPENPYQIDSAERLARLARVVNEQIDDSDGMKFSEKYYVQTADIDLGIHEWIPVGNGNINWDQRKESYIIAFKGHFNGNGHIISNVSIGDDTSAYNFGVFGCIADKKNSAVITNVNLIGIDIQVTRGTVGGGLVGDVGERGYVENCTVEGVINEDMGLSSHIGGLAGVNHCAITGCKANVSISRSGGKNIHGGRTGGLVGINSGTVKDSIASGSVTICDLSPLHKAIANALIGNNDNKGTVINSNGNGKVTLLGYSSGGALASALSTALYDGAFAVDSASTYGNTTLSSDSLDGPLLTILMG